MTRRDLVLVALGAAIAVAVAAIAAGIDATAWYFVGTFQTGLAAAGVIRHLSVEREAAVLARESLGRELDVSWRAIAALRRELGMPPSEHLPDPAQRKEGRCSSSPSSAA
jgi:hypothetical protein